MAKIKSSISEAVVAKVLGDGAKFIITELTPDGPKPVYDGAGQLMTFMTGAEAGKAASKLSDARGGKFQPRPVNDDAWRAREADRAKTKEYLPLPWEKERWWLDLKDIWGDHYPHVAIKDGAFVAFTENHEKGAADIQTRIKPGKYLERYFAELFNQYVIRDLCTAFAEKYEDNMLQWASTREEIKEVYETGPSSCMSKSVNAYKCGDVHPCEVYAAGDLQIVYLKKQGKVSARAVVWPDKKTYSTIYGDKGRMEPLLNKLGYKFAAPHDAKLLAIKVPQGKYHQYVVPHLDHVGWVYKDGDALRVGSAKQDDVKQINASGAAGVTELVGYVCTNCKSDHFAQRNMSSVFYCDSKAQTWCNACAKKDAQQCPITGYWVAKDQFIEIPGAKPMWKRHQPTHGFVCAGSGKVAWTEGRVLMKDGSYWSASHFKAHGHTCNCGKGLSKAEKGCDSDCRTAYALQVKKAKGAIAPPRQQQLGGTITGNSLNSWTTFRTF